jgi:hypothetical protein
VLSGSVCRAALFRSYAPIVLTHAPFGFTKACRAEHINIHIILPQKPLKKNARTRCGKQKNPLFANRSHAPPDRSKMVHFFAESMQKHTIFASRPGFSPKTTVNGALFQQE